MNPKAPGIKIKFSYNIDTGEIEQFIIDDQAPTASEDYHDKVANLIAQKLAKNPTIVDAGVIRHIQHDHTSTLSPSSHSYDHPSNSQTIHE